MIIKSCYFGKFGIIQHVTIATAFAALIKHATAAVFATPDKHITSAALTKPAKYTIAPAVFSAQLKNVTVVAFSIFAKRGSDSAIFTHQPIMSIQLMFSLKQSSMSLSMLSSLHQANHCHCCCCLRYTSQACHATAVFAAPVSSKSSLLTASSTSLVTVLICCKQSAS